MIKKRILKDDGRYLIYYSFPHESDSIEDGHQDALTTADMGVVADVGDAMEPDAKAMGCDCNSPAGEDV
ncbi:MAG: hypothetical protein GX795_10135 [Firmicutes bacterium]|jgi:hypothetical protein|nr:hypothetical protein [Bacillota bacterium]